jgi:type VI secretion system protein VasG
MFGDMPGARRLPAGRHAQDPSLRNALLAISRQFERVKAEAWPTRLAQDRRRFARRRLASSDGASARPRLARPAARWRRPQMGKQEALKKFTVDLTEQARKGKMDPITGRDDEIRQIVDILMRRRQNNPILDRRGRRGQDRGGRGLRAAPGRGDVPPQLKDVSLLSAGHRAAAGRRQHEGRVRAAAAPGDRRGAGQPKPIILFIDEIHTLVGAGGAAGTGDAANLLKPALARGKLRTIGATTWAEYKKYIEKDPALTRRFQTVQVDEPDEDKAILMLRGVASTMEKHHRCSCSTRRSKPRSSCRTATSRRASCPTRR